MAHCRKPCLSIQLLFLHFLLWQAYADVYMHNPRGSNNRLNEDSPPRRNNNRLFDSQNNNNGGYNVGEKTFNARPIAGDQYEMEYLMSGPQGQSSERKGKSFLTVEWTNQHGCGDDDLNCNIVLQYMCQPESLPGNVPHKLRNGQNTGTQPEGRPIPTLGLHEPVQWYDICKARTRNKGLFLADQKLRTSSSTSTRQNPNGARSGYECPEERDYYPYWHPNDWLDETVYVKRKEDCAFYEEESYNNKLRGSCFEFAKPRNEKHKSSHNNKWDCVRGGGKWVEFSSFFEIHSASNTKEKCAEFGRRNPHLRIRWAIPHFTFGLKDLHPTIELNKRCLILPPPVKCEVAPTSRPNHLGNGEAKVALRHTWILPYSAIGERKRCVFRIRYNISTDDYNISSTFASSNELKSKQILVRQSPIENNPIVQYGESKIDLQLAINTAQFGRTFQDRSHTFVLRPRPVEMNDKIIHNINVRGKRGNIVQVYPAVEYDFIPRRSLIQSSDLVHFQWTGSNRNPNGFDGEGRRGTDRSNIVQMASTDVSYPMDREGTLVQNAKIVYKMDPNLATKTPEDLAVMMASACAFETKSQLFSTRLPTEYNRGPFEQLALLDYFPPSCSLPLLQMKKGTYFFMCTRNNNFSNRAQKGRMTVV